MLHPSGDRQRYYVVCLRRLDIQCDCCYTTHVRAKRAAGPFIVFMTPVFADFRCHPRIRLRGAAPFVFSAREENLVTEEEGSVYLAVVRSDALESVRTAREPIILSFGVK